MNEIYRVIIDSAKSGPRNMATDEALLHVDTIINGSPHNDASALSPQHPTIRFYQWSEPTLSLGYFQAIHDRKSHRSSIECEIVRRRTGGGAILHDNELTYSFSAGIEDRVANSTTEIYDTFHQTLVEALRDWEIDARLADQNDVAAHGDQAFLCFQRRSIGDVVIDGHKIAGSAQRRKMTRCLQHGSVLLSKSKYAPELPGIAQITGCNLSFAELASAWTERLTQRLGTLQKGEFFPVELDKVSELEEHFASGDWINRR